MAGASKDGGYLKKNVEWRLSLGKVTRIKTLKSPKMLYGLNVGQ